VAGRNWITGIPTGGMAVVAIFIYLHARTFTCVAVQTPSKFKNLMKTFRNPSIAVLHHARLSLPPDLAATFTTYRYLQTLSLPPYLHVCISAGGRAAASSTNSGSDDPSDPPDLRASTSPSYLPRPSRPPGFHVSMPAAPHQNSFSSRRR
jgi:hypothetical protein